MSSLKEIQLKLIECPVCYDALKPPVTTCLNGHGICDKCRPKMEKCPVCKYKFSAVKNTLLNQIIESVSVDCKYSSKGCKGYSSTSDVKEHEKVCNYKSEICCVCFGSEILSMEFSDHLKTHEKPKSSVTFNQAFSVMLDRLKNKDQYYSYAMAFVKDIQKHFLVRMKVNQKENFILLLVQYTGKKEEASDYVFSVKINQSKPSDKPRYFIFNGICTPYFFEMKDVDSHPRSVKLDLKAIFLDDNYVFSKIKILMEIKCW